MAEFRSPLPEFSQLLVGASDAMHGLRKTPSAPLNAQQIEAIRTLLDFTNEYGSVISEALERNGN